MFQLSPSSPAASADSSRAFRDAFACPWQVHAFLAGHPPASMHSCQAAVALVHRLQDPALRRAAWQPPRGIAPCGRAMMQVNPIHLAAASQLVVPGMDVAWKYFLAGGVCAAASHGGTVPIDVVKTRLQTDPALRQASMISGTTTILASEGPGALFGGLGSTLMGYLIQGSLKYGCYEVFKPLVVNAHVFDQRLFSFAVAAMAAELLGSTALCPLEATRIRLVSDPQYGKEVFDALPKMLSERGIGIFASLPAIFMKQVPYTVVQLVSFEVLTKQAYGTLMGKGIDVNGPTALAVSTCCALVAAILSSLASQPGDSVLSEVNKGSRESRRKQYPPDGSILNVVQAMGWSDFFRGTQARLVHMCTIVTIQLVLYDNIKILVGLEPTGATR